jgi:hypothetical protein
VNRYGILTDSYRAKVTEPAGASPDPLSNAASGSNYTARQPSDHFPVMVEISY